MADQPPSGPDPQPIEPEPYDREADERGGARVRDVGGADAGSNGTPSGRAWALACHLGGLADFANVFFGVGILVPLVIWLVMRNRDPFIDQHGKEAINFQINVLFWSLVFLALSCCLVGIPFVVALPIAEVVLVILASIQAAEGRPYRYPLTVRVVT